MCCVSLYWAASSYYHASRCIQLFSLHKCSIQQTRSRSLFKWYFVSVGGVTSLHTIPVHTSGWNRVVTRNLHSYQLQLTGWITSELHHHLSLRLQLSRSFLFSCMGEGTRANHFTTFFSASQLILCKKSTSHIAWTRSPDQTKSSTIIVPYVSKKVKRSETWNMQAPQSPLSKRGQRARQKQKRSRRFGGSSKKPGARTVFQEIHESV